MITQRPGGVGQEEMKEREEGEGEKRGKERSGEGEWEEEKGKMKEVSLMRLTGCLVVTVQALR